MTRFSLAIAMLVVCAIVCAVSELPAQDVVSLDSWRPQRAFTAEPAVSVASWRAPSREPVAAPVAKVAPKPVAVSQPAVVTNGYWQQSCNRRGDCVRQWVRIP